MADLDVMTWATRERRVLLTFDKDFGELAQRSALPRACGIVFLRMPMPKPVDVGQRLAELITA
jgi:predicted nuclease of predicted toxin-antitoxin system